MIGLQGRVKEYLSTPDNNSNADERWRRTKERAKLAIIFIPRYQIVRPQGKHEGLKAESTKGNISNSQGVRSTENQEV